MSILEVFPTLLSCTKLESEYRVYDVKFYPYATADDEQIFAAVAMTDTFVCRPKLGSVPPFEVLRWFRDDTRVDEQLKTTGSHPDDKVAVSLNSLCWMKHPVTGNPLLCVGGESPHYIKILDVESGEVCFTLTGHGKGVNDLAVSPLATNILASASEDYTIRLWNLAAERPDLRCVAMFAGEGHRSPVLTMKFHPNGKWILSGGIDNAVCLWAVPDTEELQSWTDDAPAYPQPRIVYYPHFFSNEVHSNFVDCFEFYGDLILSRASNDPGKHNNAILLWKIDGFNSQEPPPEEPPIPRPGVNTRSSFPHSANNRGFQRLLTFDMSDSDRYYQRFALFHQVNKRPILVMGNQKSEYHFWDLELLEEGVPGQMTISKSGRKKSSRAYVADDTSGAAATSSTNTTPAAPDRRNVLGDRFGPMPSHFKQRANTNVVSKEFGTSQMAWSPDGTWLVGVGDSGMMCIFHRDKTAVK